MDQRELRHGVISALLQAGEPLTLQELAAECGLAADELRDVLDALLDDGSVVEGRLSSSKPRPQYRWQARWAAEVERRTAASKRALRAAVEATGHAPDAPLGLETPPAQAFCDYIVNEYQPPEDKRLLVFLQCAVRRPFSSSPSHASMRRAISVATGFDPGADFVNCPVHVVVLASTIGPAPYEFEDVWPVTVRSGGVKHFDPTTYARARPILAQRMASYVTTHGGNYDHIATFTDGRYAEVMEEARRVAGVDFPVLPDAKGERVTRRGKSRPRKYWEKYWIQLYREIVSRLRPAHQARAEARLREMDVECDAGCR